MGGPGTNPSQILSDDCYSALKREEILKHATTWMNLEDALLSEISPLRCSQVPSGGCFRKDRLRGPGWETRTRLSNHGGWTQVEQEEGGGVGGFWVDFEGRANSTG